MRFPQAKTVSSSYGSAIHKAIERLIVSKKREKTDDYFDDEDSKTVKEDKKLSEKEKLIKWFEDALLKERMSERDFEYYREKGRGDLSAFYEQKNEDFNGDDLSEVDFKNEGVIISDSKNRTAHLTGKIDKIFKDENREYKVVDFKTGKAVLEWESSDDDKKVKLNNYKRQLLFYKLLMENSSRYKGSVVSKGVLQFVEPIKEKTVKGTVKDKIVALDLDLKNITNEEDNDYERLSRLVCIVYEKIMNLDFPDVSEYDKNLKGIRAFEDWLLENN